MNKQELINKVANMTGLRKSDANKAIEAMTDCISTALKRGDSVRFVNFGTFSVTKRKATTGRNPRTGAAIRIPAKSLPKFKPGKALREMVAKAARAA